MCFSLSAQRNFQHGCSAPPILINCFCFPPTKVLVCRVVIYWLLSVCLARAFRYVTCCFETPVYIVKASYPLQLTDRLSHCSTCGIYGSFSFLCLIQFLIQQQRKLLQGFQCIWASRSSLIFLNLAAPPLCVYAVHPHPADRMKRVITDNAVCGCTACHPCMTVSQLYGRWKLKSFCWRINQLLQLLFYGIGTDKGYLIQFQFAADTHAYTSFNMQSLLMPG